MRTSLKRVAGLSPTSNQNRRIPAALVVLVGATLAGCSPGLNTGFRTKGQSARSASNPSSDASGISGAFPTASSGAPAAAGTPVIAQPVDTSIHLQTTELSPVQAQINTTGLAHIDNFPAGAVIDVNTNAIRWIPKRGQAGEYHFIVHGATSTRDVYISVAPLAEATLAAGPTGLYKPGEVGFVYVHGKGNVNRCASPADLAAYWGNGPELLVPGSLVTRTCYDGRQAVELAAPGVAQQILAANCGSFNKCIVITHSMGGLMMEHMFTHDRAATAADRYPAMYQNQALYAQVKARTLFVISLASAAGGSKVSNIATDPGQHNYVQAVAGTIAEWSGDVDPATSNLNTQYASDYVAPLHEDTGVPFFMVGGYSKQTLAEDGFFRQTINIFNTAINSLGDQVFNADQSLASLDWVTQFAARSDGLVDFRSSCGVADDSQNGGPGVDATLAQNFVYCATAAKKANHYVWFLSNQNHFLMSLPWGGCFGSAHPCEFDFPVNGSFASDPAMFRMNLFQALNYKLGPNAIANSRPVTPIAVP